MRTTAQHKRAERDRVTKQFALATQQQGVSARFAERARLAVAGGDLPTAVLYQRESAERHVRAQQHMATARRAS
jgi:hypothetical protein